MILMSFSSDSRTKDRNKAMTQLMMTMTMTLERIRDRYYLLTFVYSPVVDDMLLSYRQMVSNEVGYSGARGR